jgi:hypothetical protein
MNKTATLPPALPKKPSYYPKLSFNATMKLFLVTEQGETLTIGACSEAQFEALIEQALSTYQNSKKASQERINACSMELAGLSYEEPLARWFALLTLQEYKIPASVYLTYEDACASEHQEMLYHD